MKTSKEMAENVQKRSNRIKVKRKVIMSFVLIFCCVMPLMLKENKIETKTQPVFIYQGEETEGMYAIPENGQVFGTFSIDAAKEQYKNQDVKFIVVIDIFSNEKEVTSQEEEIEYQRLANEGIKFFKFDDGETVALVSGKVMSDFPLNEQYGYFLRFYDDAMYHLDVFKE